MIKLHCNTIKEERVMNNHKFVTDDGFDTPQAHGKTPWLELAPKVDPTVEVSETPNPGLDMLVNNLNMSSCSNDNKNLKDIVFDPIDRKRLLDSLNIVTTREKWQVLNYFD